jgi:phosphatidylserine decarboxylase
VDIRAEFVPAGATDKRPWYRIIRREMREEDIETASPGERVQGMVQHLLPHTLLTALMYHSTRWRFAPWKNWQIRWFIGRYGVDIAEALHADARDYTHFNAFFTRALRPGSRPLEGGAETIVSPADGTVSAIGVIQSASLLQAKGQHYSLHSLLGEVDARTAAFEDGCFASLYLSPRDYHRVHMPVDGRLCEMIYIPGRLFSVNSATARAVPRLFTRNERLVCLFETALGPMALILVGAMLVSGMETVWAGPVAPPHGQAMRSWRYEGNDAIELSRGEEMGRFNTGSTVIVLFPRASVHWQAALQAGDALRMGQALAKVESGA